MSKFFAYAACAAISCAAVFSACQKEVGDSLTSEEKVTLNVTIPLPDTKALAGINETSISNYQAFLFKEDGTIEDYASQSSPDISLDCTIGKKTVVVVANAPSLGDVMDYETLLTRTSRLADNALDAFIMEGKTGVTILSKQDVSVEVTLIRKVARIKLVSLQLAIDMPQYNSKPFKVSSVYLINVPSEMPYFANDETLSWSNKFEYVPEDDNSLLYDDMEDFEITPDTPYTFQNAFYCYANNTSEDTFDTEWAPRKTRLVVEATLGDERYYYPVTLPTLGNNRTYDVTLVITRPGAKTPDSKVDKFAMGVECVVKDWDRGSTILQEI